MASVIKSYWLYCGIHTVLYSDFCLCLMLQSIRLCHRGQLSLDNAAETIFKFSCQRQILCCSFPQFPVPDALLWLLWLRNSVGVCANGRQHWQDCDTLLITALNFTQISPLSAEEYAHSLTFQVQHQAERAQLMQQVRTRQPPHLLLSAWLTLLQPWHPWCVFDHDTWRRTVSNKRRGGGWQISLMVVSSWHPAG